MMSQRCRKGTSPPFLSESASTILVLEDLVSSYEKYDVEEIYHRLFNQEMTSEDVDESLKIATLFFISFKQLTLSQLNLE